MDVQVQIASVFAGLLIWTLVAYSLRRARLLPSYAVLWTAIGAALALLPAYAEMLRWVSTNVLGLIGANHFVYLILFGFLLLYTFYLTQKICELTNRVERAISALAILEAIMRDAGGREPMPAARADRNHAGVILHGKSETASFAGDGRH